MTLLLAITSPLEPDALTSALCNLIPLLPIDVALSWGNNIFRGILYVDVRRVERGEEPGTYNFNGIVGSVNGGALQRHLLPIVEAPYAGHTSFQNPHGQIKVGTR